MHGHVLPSRYGCRYTFRQIVEGGAASQWNKYSFGSSLWLTSQVH